MLPAPGTSVTRAAKRIDLGISWPRLIEYCVPTKSLVGVDNFSGVSAPSVISINKDSPQPWTGASSPENRGSHGLAWTPLPDGTRAEEEKFWLKMTGHCGRGAVGGGKKIFLILPAGSSIYDED